MGKLSKIDSAAEAKGSGMQTAWQFVKFIFVSLGACIVQVVVLAVLYNIPAIKELSTTPFHWFVFDYPVIAGARCGLAYFISTNTANVTAQIVAFFINKEKTFNSGANTAVVLPIYIIFTILLICFSAWLNPFLFSKLIGKVIFGIAITSGLATTIATAVCSALQFFLYFPVDKILFHKKKEAKTAEAK